MTRETPTQAQLLELWEHTSGFIDAQQISCAEAVHQTDRVIENAYDFIEKAGEIVGWHDDPEEA